MEVLDEVAAGGRLTRSLRKRLTSVDSEASSSRPNTPIGTKLNSINEQNSPPRSTRMTRRNSVTNLAATPAKTPSKSVSSRAVASRLDTKSEINSPMRRTNRRRSISITEDETTASVKSTPKIEVVPEEESSTLKRLTRSASKSPLQLISNGANVQTTSSRPRRATKAGPGPKSNTRSNEPTNNVDSDVEVIDLESEDEENVQAKVKTKQNKSIYENKEEIVKVAKVAEERPKKNSLKSPKKTNAENKKSDNDKSPSKSKQKRTQLSPKFLQKLDTESEIESDKDVKNQSIDETEINETVNETNNEKKVKTSKKSEILTNSKPENTKPPPVDNLISPKNNSNGAALVTDVINLKCLSPEAIHQIIGYQKNSPDANQQNLPEKCRAVGFDDSIDDDATKCSYPKTPGLTKSKSYIELDSSREEDIDSSFQALSVSDSIEMMGQEMLQTDTKTDAAHTPIKSIAKLKVQQSSTPQLNDATTGGSEIAPKTASNEEEEEEVHALDADDASSIKLPKSSSTNHRKSLVDSPSSSSLAKSPRKSPKSLNKSISAGDEMKALLLNTTGPSELEQKSPKRRASSPNKSSTKISENLGSPHKSPKKISLEPALQKSELIAGVEQEETKLDSSDNKQTLRRSSRSLELARNKSLDASLQSPKNIALRNSPQHTQSPKISTSMKSPEKLKSPKKSLSPKIAVETYENSQTETKQSDEPSSTQVVTKLSEASPRAGSRSFASSWTPNVCGVSNNTKIDQIISEREKTPNIDLKCVNDEQQESATLRRSRFESDDDDENIAFNDGDDEEEEADEELADNEKARKKHEFVLDEAMEVDDDYQSGDSMDSEERRELENNEVLCDGESIGSEDTTDGNEEEADEDDDDDDEENGSFITDDSNEESLIDYSDNDDETEHLLEVERKNKKNLKKQPYKRILKVDDDDESESTKDNDEDAENSEDDNKSKRSDVEDIETLIDNIDKIVSEYSYSENDDSVDRDEVVEQNKTKTRRSGDPLDRSKTFDVPPEEKNVVPQSTREESETPNNNKNNNMSLKEKRRSLNRAKAAEEPADEQATNHNKDDAEDEDTEGKNHENQNHEDVTDEDQEVEDNEEDGDVDERKNYLNSSKLSETALKLQVFDTDNEKSDDQQNDDDNEAMETTLQTKSLNASRKKIIKHLQQSERFNKTVHDFRLENPEEESGSPEAEETSEATNILSKNSRRAASLGSSKNIELRRSHRLSFNQHHRSKEAEAAAAACESTSSNSSEGENQQSAEKQMYKTLQRYSLGRNQEKSHKQDVDASNKKEPQKGSSVKSSQTREKMNSDDEEFLAINGDNDSESHAEANIHEQYNLEKISNKKKHNKSSAALSVSLGYIKERRDERIAPTNAHSSFTIGVVVRNTQKNRGDTPESNGTPGSSLNGDADDDAVNRKSNVKGSASDTETDAAIFSSAEEEELEKLEYTKDVPLSAGLNSSAVYTKQTTEVITDFKNSSKQRRTICIPADYGDFTTSQSFIESVAAESKGEFVSTQASTKRKRLSKSFCAGASLDTTELEEVHHLNKKSKLAAHNDIAINSSTPRTEQKKNIKEKKTEKKNIEKEEQTEQKNNIDKTTTQQQKKVVSNDEMKQRVLSRCEEILEAANRAKLEAKLNSKKSKVKLLKKKKSKKMANTLQQQQQQQELKNVDENKMMENDVQITQKQLKRQERAKLEVEKALKASANLIFNKTEKNVVQNMAKQQLSKAVVQEVCSAETSAPFKENKNKHFLPSKADKKIMKTSNGDWLEMRLVEKKKKKIPPPEEIQLSTGTVRVEPATPTKHLIRSGFRESPMTPLSLGFKVRHILSAGQDTPPAIPAKERKRKRNVIEEPRHTLPKPQWTQSGVFIEEEIYATAPITTAGSTKFVVSALNGVRKKKTKLAKTSAGAASVRSLGSSSVNSSAHQFKNNALFRDDIRRESSRELIQRKKRKNM